MTEKESKKPEAPQASEANAEAGISYSALISDPFGLSNIAVTESQNIAEPLELDEPSEDNDEIQGEFSEPAEAEETAVTQPFEAAEDDGALDRLADAIAEQKAEIQSVAEAAADWMPDSPEAAAEAAATELAAQIAEDEALQAQLAKEAEAAEEAQKADPELQAALPQRAEDGSLDLAEIQSCIEALLFMVDKPVSMERLREMLGPDFELPLFQEAMSALMDRYKHASHGMEIVQVGGGYQFRTKAGRAALAKKLAKVQTQRLSSGAMESLAIVAYKQPVMKEDVDKIRGVDSSYFIRLLLDKKLISISGRSDLPGRPMVYGTTDEFLSVFGLKDLTSLPSLREIEQMIPSSQSANPEDEDPRVKELRKLVGQMKADTSTSLVYDPREDDKILKEIREKVNAIPTSTPSLDEQRELEKQAKAAAQAPTAPEGELPLPPVQN